MFKLIIYLLHRQDTGASFYYLLIGASRMSRIAWAAPPPIRVGTVHQIARHRVATNVREEAAVHIQKNILHTSQ